jgi:uncharacterized membrane protein
MTDKDKIIQEYLSNSKKQSGQVALGLILGSLVFIIPMIIIIANSWWMPFDDNVEIGTRWCIVAFACMGLMYIAILVDKLTRKF